jgi:adenylylsulfate kinase
MNNLPGTKNQSSRYNITQKFKVSRKDRNSQNMHKSFVIWFTGLSGSGKSTLANEVELILNKIGISTYILDGDNLRLGINSDLDFTINGRSENIRRVSEIAKLMVDSGLIVLTSFISPFEKDRNMAKGIIGKEDFFEIHISCPLSVCEERDIKGLYAKARKGEIKNFTGIDSPYEEPQSPNLKVDTSKNDLSKCVRDIMIFIENRIKLE